MALMLVVRAAWAFILSAADALVKNLLPVGLAPWCSPVPSSVAEAAAAPAAGIVSIAFWMPLMSGVVFCCLSPVSLLPSPSNLSPIFRHCYG